MKHLSEVGIGTDKSAEYHVWQFDSVREFADMANANPEKAYSATRGTRNGYFGTESFPQAYRLACDGWSAPRSHVDGVLAPLREKLGQILTEVAVPVFDVVGSRPDIDRYLDGELECMIEDVVEEIPASGKVFTMVVDSTMADNPSNSAANVQDRGAVLIGLIESFALLGLQLELWVERTVASHTLKDAYASFLVCVNPAGEPLDIDNVMFAVGHPDFNRRLSFSVGESIPLMRKHFGHRPPKQGGYYGRAKQGAHLTEMVGASTVISLDGNSAMTADPQSWILNQLEMQGVYSRD